MKEILLLDCPFCGHGADLWRKYGKYGFFMQVECSVCGAQTKAFSTGSKVANECDFVSPSAIRASEAWNRRGEG